MNKDTDNVNGKIGRSIRTTFNQMMLKIKFLSSVDMSICRLPFSQWFYSRENTARFFCTLSWLHNILLIEIFHIMIYPHFISLSIASWNFNVNQGYSKRLFLYHTGPLTIIVLLSVLEEAWWWFSEQTVLLINI